MNATEKKKKPPRQPTCICAGCFTSGVAPEVKTKIGKFCFMCATAGVPLAGGKRVPLKQLGQYGAGNTKKKAKP